MTTGTDTARDGTIVDNLVRNPGFEEPLGEGGDATWVLGAADAENDKSAIDIEVASEGSSSLRFEPHLQCVATQVLRGPLADLEGRTVSVAVDIRQERAAAPPTVMVIAFNPELPDDDWLKTGVAGKTQIMAPPGRDGRFVTYRGKFVASAAATSLQIMLLASGRGGRVWFDNVVVQVSEPDEA